MRVIILIVCCFLIQNKLKSQESIWSFEGLECAGTVPQDFITSTREKFEQYSGSSGEIRTSKMTDEQDFHMVANYQINEMLYSGKALYGDPVTNYLNRIKDLILVNDNELKNSIRVYTMRSSSVNAMCTSQGIIFVNIGLIARLKSEAEIAGILSHEIAHFAKKHQIEGYVDQKALLGNKSKTRKMTFENLLDTLSQRSKKHEFEADSLGLLYFLKTSYNADAFVSMFDILHYSFLPFKEYKLPFDFLNKGELFIPEFYFTPAVTPISEMTENFDDEKQSHPNIYKRKNRVKEIITKNNKTKGKDFLISEKKFLEIKTLAQFENVKIQMLNAEYGNSIYDAYGLLQQFPSHPFLELTIGKCLYGLAKYKALDEYHYVADSYNKYEGEVQQIHYLFRQFTKPQLLSVAIKYNIELNKKYNLSFIDLLINDLIFDLIQFTEVSYKDFTSKKTEIIANKEYKNVKNNKEWSGQEIKELQAKYNKFYLNLISESDINAKKYNESFLKATEDKNRKLNEIELSAKEVALVKEKQKRKMEKDGPGLFVKNVVSLDPYIFKAKNRKSINFIDLEAKKKSHIEVLQNESKTIGVGLRVIDNQDVSRSGTASINELIAFKDWINEKTEHINDSIIPLSSDLLSKNQFTSSNSYFLWNGVVQVSESDFHYYYFSVYDLRSFRRVYFNSVFSASSITDDKIEKQVNRDFFQISR